ncbi:O-antigen ligase family protein [Spirosoma luteum]|uniref:O-antigen ligase family protein n=1 Tax=Spirosoma luteum TaxID=431553 RepID=UPI000366B04F|nr:O-antigen ligase family protein [Spirosoma luteum]
MITWLHRLGLFYLLFGIGTLTHGGDHQAYSDMLVNLAPILSMGLFVYGYFSIPGLYKTVGWVLGLGIILLVLESKYEYGQYIYSYFVIKRFAYCSVAIGAYCLAIRSEPIDIKQAVNIIFFFFFFDQIVLGRIFGYAFNSDTRTTLSPDAYYFLIPFLYYLANYLKHHRPIHLITALFCFLVIIVLLHRTVISSAVVAAGIVVGLSLLGKVSSGGGLPLGRTLILFTLLVTIALPFVGLLPEKKVAAMMTSIGGILSPEEDNTASWRVEQSEYYLSQIPERPLFGWRYEGYDRGEIMENPDFEEKGTIIHSQYIDMLFNYGAFGLLIHLVLILGALVVLYRSGQILSTDQLVLFGFIASGLIYGAGYQFPVQYWGLVGVGMYMGLKRKPTYSTVDEPTETAVDYDLSPAATLFKPI